MRHKGVIKLDTSYVTTGYFLNRYSFDGFLIRIWQFLKIIPKLP